MIAAPPQDLKGKAIQAGRVLCRRNLLDFCRGAWPVIEPAIEFVGGWMVDALCRHLEAFARRDIQHLLINMPPGCFKSTLVSVLFPAWVWTWNPAARFLAASYNADLATRDSVRCRQIVQSEWFQSRWPLKFIGDRNQKTQYETNERGWRLAISVGTGTGLHPDFFIGDDLHNVRQSESDLERKSCVDWWTGTMSSRGIARNVGKAVTGQRLHQMDVYGHIIHNEVFKHRTGWEHICLPMEWEPDRMPKTSLGWQDPRKKEGELLWPGLYTRPMVQSLRQNLGSLRSAGQLQQRPMRSGGQLFQRAWFELVNLVPIQTRNFIRYWDKASTEDGGDWSAGVLMAEYGGLIYVIDVQRGQWSPLERNRVIRATATNDRVRFGPGIQTWIEEEGGSGGKESAQISVRDLIGHVVYTERVTGDKWSRAQPLAAQAEANNVKILADKGQPPAWLSAYLDEMEAFPVGANDDQVDGSSGAFNKLAALRTPDKIQARPATGQEIDPRKGQLLHRTGRAPFQGKR